ncbi:MAG: response regulator [Clostridia bacterium]|nr:response regulator [Clostridia bacterium]
MQHQYRVLIVEDDPMVSMINEQYVNRSKDFRVVGKCRDGKSALDFLEQNDVDLMVLDVFMPLMDGFETLRQIRKNKKSVDVIMVTAANDRSSLEEALHLGAVDYLVKPFTYDRFRIALDKYISHLEAFKSVDVLNQKNIDYIFGNSHKKNDEQSPKGIQEKTLNTILDEMKKNPSAWMTGEEVAERIGLTGVTVRRYLNHLAEKGELLSEIDYETGGRPCMRYRLTNHRRSTDN